MASHVLLGAVPSRTKCPELAEVLHQMVEISQSHFHGCQAVEGRRSRGGWNWIFSQQRVRAILGSEPTP